MTRATSLICLCVALVLSGCAKDSSDKNYKLSDKNYKLSDKNLVIAGDPKQVKTIGDQDTQFQIIAKGALDEKLSLGSLMEPTDQNLSIGIPLVSDLSGQPKNRSILDRLRRRTKPLPDDFASLQFGMPIDLVGKTMVFGGVVVKVSDRVNEDMGRLKLAELPALLVTTKIQKPSLGDPKLLVLNCGASCESQEPKKEVLGIPILAVDQVKKTVILDLSKLGDILELTAIRKNDYTLSQYKSIKSRVVTFDFSKNTLVFDVEAQLVKKSEALNQPNPKVTVVTNRWYLKLGDVFNPQFTKRKPINEVGFFTTKRNSEPWIVRYDLDRIEPQEGVKYYIKNVPPEFQKGFVSAFDEWNEKFLSITGKKIFNYEFISKDDPRSQLLVTGDVRYNIIEWDLVNRAAYGGLGPSIAHQYTGEVFSANVLVQGPHIIELFREWFQARHDSDDLIRIGRDHEADGVISKSLIALNAKLDALHLDGDNKVFKLKLGKDLELAIRSQDPSLEDPLMQRVDFDLPPVGYTFEAYMEGYFHDMVTHELGHNLGLRHNFRGNLGASDVPELGKVSRSIMEYLGRGYRYLDRIGPYDEMAIAYGYTGATPTHADWFCTDDDVSSLETPEFSAECNRDDATNDPFGFYDARLRKAVDYLVARGKANAPAWTVDDMKRELTHVFTGFGLYYVTGPLTASKWTNFLTNADRPKEPSQVAPYVFNKLKSYLCDASFEQEVTNKESTEAKKKTLDNIKGLMAQAKEVFKDLIPAAELECQ
ncbi:MAG: zinc-dependent metalloprotease [Bdellovibrio sp.]|nr:zinc-dependent metalloprotease [Bdellovibrio sp.]